MGDIFMDDEGDIFMEDEEDLYAEKEILESSEPEKEVWFEECDLSEEDDESGEFSLEPVTDEVFALLAGMVKELNDEHDCYLKSASPTEIAGRRTGKKISPKFEIERIEEGDIADYEATVALHDWENEESEHGDPAHIARLIMSIRYLSGHHHTSYGI
jgi:hypothetical protein